MSYPASLIFFFDPVLLRAAGEVEDMAKSTEQRATLVLQQAEREIKGDDHVLNFFIHLPRYNRCLRLLWY